MVIMIIGVIRVIMVIILIRVIRVIIVIKVIRVLMVNYYQSAFNSQKEKTVYRNAQNLKKLVATDLS